MPTDDEKERPTQPDLAVFDCPECQDSKGDPQGEIVERTFQGGGYRIRTVRCPTCLGSKILDREGMARWQQKQKTLR